MENPNPPRLKLRSQQTNHSESRSNILSAENSSNGINDSIIDYNQPDFDPNSIKIGDLPPRAPEAARSQTGARTPAAELNKRAER